MVEPQIIINKSWAEHKAEQEIKRLKGERMFKFFLGLIVVIVVLWLLYSFWDWAKATLGNWLYVILVLIIVLVVWLISRKRKHRFYRHSRHRFNRHKRHRGHRYHKHRRR